MNAPGVRTAPDSPAPRLQLPWGRQPYDAVAGSSSVQQGPVGRVTVISAPPLPSHFENDWLGLFGQTSNIHYFAKPVYT